jgi:RNA polymerase sigma factor (sigma-70 family)
LFAAAAAGRIAGRSILWTAQFCSTDARMDSETPFPELLRRVRAGEETAAAELVRLYEPEVRRAVRMSLTDPRMRRIFDSGDICQSVLANFFVHVMGGSFDLDNQGQLVRLLVAMARNKLVDHARKPGPWKESNADPAVLDNMIGSEDSPSHIVAQDDLARALRAELTAEERQIGELRSAGMEWSEIAKEVGGTSDSVRKKLNRAVARVCGRLGLGGVESV